MSRKKLSKEDLAALLDSEQEKCRAFAAGTAACVVAVSGGNASAVALIRCLELFGSERVYPVFADTNSEDADLYRFLDDLDAYLHDQWSHAPIERLNDGRNIWDVFDQTGIMRIITPKGQACKASVELKIKPQIAYVRSRWLPGDVVIASGMDATEPERISGMNGRWAAGGYVAIAPLVVRPWLSECEYREFLSDRGLEPCRLYQDGYPHNNCGGACALAGIKQWAGVARDYPERFVYSKDRERAFFERTGFSVLRDQRGGTVKPYPLYQLEADIEAGRELSDDWRSNCTCAVPETVVQLDLFHS